MLARATERGRPRPEVLGHGRCCWWSAGAAAAAPARPRQRDRAAGGLRTGAVRVRASAGTLAAAGRGRRRCSPASTWRCVPTRWRGCAASSIPGRRARRGLPAGPVLRGLRTRRRHGRRPGRRSAEALLPARGPHRLHPVGDRRGAGSGGRAGRARGPSRRWRSRGCASRARARDPLRAARRQRHDRADRGAGGDQRRAW